MHKPKLKKDEFRIIITGEARYEENWTSPENKGERQGMKFEDAALEVFNETIAQQLSDKGPLKVNSAYVGAVNFREVDVEA